MVTRKVLSEQSTLFTGERGSVVITRLAPGHLLLTLHGYNDGEIAEPYYAAMEAEMDAAGFLVLYMDSREQTGISPRGARPGVAGFIHDHSTFAMPYVRCTRRTAKRLFEAGITDLHYGPTHLFSRSKWLVQDRRTIALGTGNWLDEDIEIHPQLYVKWESPALARELRARLYVLRARGVLS